VETVPVSGKASRTQAVSVARPQLRIEYGYDHRHATSWVPDEWSKPDGGKAAPTVQLFNEIGRRDEATLRPTSRCGMKYSSMAEDPYRLVAGIH
jgi:hypothetical protein